MKQEKLSASMVAVGATFALGVFGAAFAGSKYTGTGNVSITKNADGSGVAMGYFGHIYNGPGMKQWIGCQRYDNTGLFCHAKTESELLASCSVNSSFLAQSVSSISPDTRVTFHWNAQGVCTRIVVVHSSEYQDKQG
jgi:hypothetical protein